MDKSIATVTLINELERLILRLSEIVGRDFPQLTDDQLNWKQSNEQWSIAECIMHLNYVADFYFPSIHKVIEKVKTNKSKPTSTFIPGWLGNRVAKGVRLSRDNRLKKQSESPQKFNPKYQLFSQVSRQEIINNFLQNQDTILQILANSKSINIQATYVPVAIYGLIRIQLGDMLKVIVYHTERHVVQAQRLLYHDNFPVNSLSATLS
ncbi:DinB family protein [Aureispira]|nr:DinB family protein [Aureispira sp.]